LIKEVIMKKIAVICACNPGNAGMYSVDLAAADLLSRNNIDFDLFTSHTPPRFARYKFMAIGIDIGFRSHYRFGRLMFKHLKSYEQLKNYSHVIYWGDFTPNPVYGVEDFYYANEFYDTRLTKEESFDKWVDLYNVPHNMKQKVMAIGNNFQHDYSSNIKFYRKYLDNLGKKFDVIMPRDSYSLNNIKSQFDPENNTIKKFKSGLDPAFLLNEKMLNCNIKPADNVFCYSFGRSQLPNLEDLLEKIELATKCKGVDLEEWLKLKPISAERDFIGAMENISTARFVVTDLYHLAINSIRLHTPVYCIGNKVSNQIGTLGDFKKNILFKMLGLENYYIEINPDLTSASDYITEVISESLSFYRGNIIELYSRKECLVKDFESDILDELN
jgi:hypothetical protein